MEINKINFDTLKSEEITKSFEDLDVNNDGKIDETDKNTSTDTEITSQITKLLAAAVDEDSELDETVTDEETTGSESSASYAELKEKLDGVNAEIAKIQEDISKLQEENKTLEETKKTLEAQKEEAQTQLEQEQAKLETEQETLANYNLEYNDVQNEVSEYNKAILKEQEKESEEYKDSMDKLTNDAIDNYDPERDGEDFQAYFNKKTNDSGFPAFSKLESMNDEASALTSDARDILSKISLQAATVYNAKTRVANATSTLTSINNRLNDTISQINGNNDSITTLQANLTTKETEKAEINKELQAILPGGGLTAKEVLAQIPAAELQLCKDNNIDLTTCKIAMGEDGIFHVYQASGASVVREYACGGGFDESQEPYIKSGSGYMNGLQEAADGEGRAVYTFSSVNECLTDGEATCCAGCYSTCSPLSFDVNGDGVKTTNETVSFDIDGDGKLDTVNNSAEWVLAFDKDGNGKAGENGSELFGDNTDLDGDGKKDGYANGFEALKALAIKEGLISSTDRVLDENDIKQLSEKYGLVMTNGYGGEAKSLSDLGITEINLAQTDDTTLTKNFDGRNNDIMTQEGATFVVNGETREYADIWNAKKDSSDSADSSETTEKTEEIKLQYHAGSNIKIKNIKNNNLALGLNKDRVLALQGNVNFGKIKDKTISNADIPQELLDEVIEIEEEEEKKEI